MYLINNRTGVAEEITDAQTDALQRPQACPELVEGANSKSGPARGKDAAPAAEYSRSSERRPRHVGKPDARTRPAPQRSSKSYAVWLLSRRDYSAANLRRKLITRGYSEQQSDEALAFVIEHHYQDDARYAEQRSRSAENRAGNARIEMSLRQKGIAPELAKAQVRQLAPEEERVIAAAARYQPQVTNESMTPKLEAKIYRFLAYRGFSAKAIRIAIQALRAGE
jgi:regulatory protein